MARQKSFITEYLEYLPALWTLGLLRTLPHPMSKAVCYHLMTAVLRLLPKRQALIHTQIAESFPELSEAAVREIALGSVKNLADGLATFAKISGFTIDSIDDWVDIEGIEHMEAAYRLGKGMITFTAHMGCWELMAVYVTHKYPRVAMVVRPLDNTKMDTMVTRVRASGKGGVIDSRKVFKDGLRLLRNNGILGVLIDQNFYKGGVFVDFFGRPAATNTLVPILARRTGCAVLPMHNLWRNGKILIRCEPPVTLSDHPDSFTAIAQDTQKLTSIVEGWIRQDPEQWMWLHNRWKRRPQSGDSIYSEKEGLRIIS